MNIYRLITESQLSSHISEEKYTKIAIEIGEVLFSTDNDEAKKDFLSRIINRCKDLAETHGVILDESAKEDNYTDAVVDYLNDKEIKAVYVNQVEGILKELFPDVEFTSEQVNSVLDQLEKGFGFLITETESVLDENVDRAINDIYNLLDECRNNPQNNPGVYYNQATEICKDIGKEDLADYLKSQSDDCDTCYVENSSIISDLDYVIDRLRFNK